MLATTVHAQLCPPGCGAECTPACSHVDALIRATARVDAAEGYRLECVDSFLLAKNIHLWVDFDVPGCIAGDADAEIVQPLQGCGWFDAVAYSDSSPFCFAQGYEGGASFDSRATMLGGSPTSENSEIRLEHAWGWVDPSTCPRDGDCGIFVAYGKALARTTVNILPFPLPGLGQKTIMGTITTSIELPDLVGSATLAKRSVSAVLAPDGSGGDTIYALVSMDQGIENIGVLQDVTGKWIASSSSSVSTPQVTVEMKSFRYNEKKLDVDTDGRLTFADAIALAAIVGTPGATDPNNLQEWDFDNDFVIDTDDVDSIQEILDLGLASGVFGDANGDNLLDCADVAYIRSAVAAGMDPFANEVIGGGNYNVHLDFDLDGDCDATDESAARALLLAPDLDPNWQIDFDDLLLILGLIGPCPGGTPGCTGDFADDLGNPVPDGMVDFGDYLYMLSLTGC